MTAVYVPASMNSMTTSVLPGPATPWDRQRLPFPGKRELARRTALAISTMEVEDIWVVVIAHYAPAEMASHLGINSGLSAPVDASFVEGTTA